MHPQCKNPGGSTPRKYNHLNGGYRTKGRRFLTELKLSVTFSSFQLMSQEIVGIPSRVCKYYNNKANQVFSWKFRKPTNPGDERYYQMVSNRENDTLMKERMRERKHREK